jgi:outer membrane protein TolC
MVMGVYSQTLNLENARLLALANSRSLAKHELSIRGGLLDERSHLYSMLPSVSAGYSASMDYLRNWVFLNPIDTFNASVTLSVTQIIFQGGKSFLQKTLNEIATKSVRLDALGEYYNVLDSVDNAYYAALESKASLEAEEASLVSAVLSLSIAEIRQSSGMINQGDYLRALADKESRENSRNQARRNLALNMAKLKILMGITGDFEIEPIDIDAYEGALARLSAITDEEGEVLFNAFWKLLVSSNPTLARAALSSQRAEINHTITKRDWVPVISATLFGTALNYSVSDGFNPAGSGGVTIRGTIPVDFWVMGNRLEKSRLSLDSSAIDYTNAYVAMEMELQGAMLNAFAQAGTVLSTRRSLEYTERNFEYVSERYRLGQSSVSDMNDASSLYINSRNSHIKSTYSFLQSLSHLRSLCAIDDERKLIDLLLGN